MVKIMIYMQWIYLKNNPKRFLRDMVDNNMTALQTLTLVKQIIEYIFIRWHCTKNLIKQIPVATAETKRNYSKLKLIKKFF